MMNEVQHVQSLAGARWRTLSIHSVVAFAVTALNCDSALNLKEGESKVSSQRETVATPSLPSSREQVRCVGRWS